ncbi:MAG: hypothetical protein KatS3mg102_1159 [Planctomycetota bacterium]|nr:MAG: hypothetical protein KatS3mg102_1159 [Planctomycetota bacterium]
MSEEHSPGACRAARAERVLVVEDQSAVREVLAESLEVLGFAPVMAGSGAQALALVEQLHGPLAAAIIDVQLPDLGGAALGARLRERQPGLPLVFTSGGRHTLAELAASAGLAPSGLAGARLLAKPFGIEALEAALAEVLGRSAPGSRG